MKKNEENVVKKIIEKYADSISFADEKVTSLHQRTAFNDTILHLAIRRGEIEDVAYLANFPDLINAKGDIGETPLHVAVKFSKLEIIEALLSSGANKIEKNYFGETPLDIAEARGDQYFDLLNSFSQ